MRCDSAQRVLAAKEKETPDCEWEGSCDGPLVDDWVKRPFETYGDETLDEGAQGLLQTRKNAQN